MKKNFFYFAMAATVALCNISCGSDDEDEPISSQKVEIAVPETADKAVAFEIPADKAVKTTSGESLNAVNITESGKAILTVKTNSGYEYLTYDASYEQKDNKHVYTLMDGNKKVGTITSSKIATRATSVADIKIQLAVELPGIGTVSFDGTVLGAKMLWDTVKQGQNLNNIARTWKVKEITMSLSGDVDCTITEPSGDLKVLANKAQENDAQLTEDEFLELCKTIEGITLDKTGMFSIEYKNATGKIKYYATKADMDNGKFKYLDGDGKSNSEVCSWNWTNENMESVSLKFRDSDFGNKFLNDKSNIAVKFYASGIAHFSVTTKIAPEPGESGKTYNASLDLTLE